MADWNELIVDELAIDFDLVEAVVRATGKLTYYISGVGHEINYANAGLATVAYQEWVAAHPPKTPAAIQVGDWVHVLLEAAGQQYKRKIIGKVLSVDFAPAAYWTLETPEGDILIIDKPGLLLKIDDPTL